MEARPSSEHSQSDIGRVSMQAVALAICALHGMSFMESAQIRSQLLACAQCSSLEREHMPAHRELSGSFAEVGGGAGAELRGRCW
jgi:hypothetical protein